MLKRKIFSVATAVMMLASSINFNVQAAYSGATEVVTLSDFVDWDANRLHITGVGSSAINNVTLAWRQYGIGGKEESDSCFKLTKGTEDAIGRFSLSDSNGTKYKFIDETTPVIYSMEVCTNGAVDSLTFQTNGSSDVATAITEDMLTADSWNILTLVYYPGVDTTERHTDLYINGKYVSTKYLTFGTSLGTEMRFAVDYAEVTDKSMYFDNIKYYRVPDFTSPAIIGDVMTCVGLSVSVAKENLAVSNGAEVVIRDASGKVMADDVVVSAGMSISTKTEITEMGIALESNPVVLSDIKAKHIDITNGAVSFITDCVGIKTTAQTLNDYVTVTAGANTARFSLNDISINGYSNPVVLSYDLYPSADISSYNFQSVGSVNVISSVFTNEKFNMDEWNNISLVVYPKDSAGYWTTELYINGYLTSTHSLKNLGAALRIVTNGSVESYSYKLDNIKFYEMFVFARPSLTSKTLNINNNVISGYLNAKTDSVDLTPAGGMSIVYAPEGNITTATTATVTNVIDGLGTYKVVYSFGSAIKTIVHVSDCNTYTDSIRDINHATFTVETNGLGGKALNDNYLKITGKDSNNESDGPRWRVTPDKENNYTYDSFGDNFIYSFDIYPNNSVKDIRFRSYTTSDHSYAISSSNLTEGEWNKIVMVFKNSDTGWSSDVYVNGKLVGCNYYSDGSRLKSPLTVRIRMNDYTTNNVCYIDNLNIATIDSFDMPKVSSDTLVINNGGLNGGVINGFYGMNVSGVKGALVVANENISYKIYNEDGTEATDSAAIEKGMYLEVSADYTSDAYDFYADEYTYTYKFNCPDFEVENVTAKITGDDLNVIVEVTEYAENSTDGEIIVAQYDSEGRFEKILIINSLQTVREFVCENIDISSNYEVFVWDLEKVEPLAPKTNAVIAE